MLNLDLGKNLAKRLVMGGACVLLLQWQFGLVSADVHTARCHECVVSEAVKEQELLFSVSFILLPYITLQVK